MSYQNILDRIPREVLPNGAIRYGVYDTNGNLIRYEYMKREDEPIEEGTPINRGLLSNIQGDLYTQDRYNIPTVTYEEIKGEYATVAENIIPTSWGTTVVANESYMAEDGTILSSNGFDHTAYPITNVCDGNDTTYFRSHQKETWVKIEFPEPRQINKLTTYLKANSSSYFESLKIQASNDDETWVDLYSSTTMQTTPTTITLKGMGLWDENKYYKFYRAVITLKDNSNAYAYLYQFETYSYWDVKKANVFNVDLPLTAYEKGKIVGIEGVSYEGQTTFSGAYLNINNLGVKRIVPDMVSGRRYSLVYDGEKWILGYNEEILKSSVASKVVFGNFTTVSSYGTTSVSVGFKPDLVICYSSSNEDTKVATDSTSATRAHVPRLITHATSSGGAVTTNGFTFTIDSSSAKTVRYIAIQFFEGVL